MQLTLEQINVGDLRLSKLLVAMGLEESVEGMTINPVPEAGQREMPELCRYPTRVCGTSHGCRLLSGGSL